MKPYENAGLLEVGFGTESGDIAAGGRLRAAGLQLVRKHGHDDRF